MLRWQHWFWALLWHRTYRGDFPSFLTTPHLWKGKPVYTKCGAISLIIQLKLLSFPSFSQEPNTMQLTLPNHIKSSKKLKYSTPKKRKGKSNIHIQNISLITNYHTRHLQWSLVTVNPGHPPVSSVQTGLLEYMYS